MTDEKLESPERRHMIGAVGIGAAAAAMSAMPGVSNAQSNKTNDTSRFNNKVVLITGATSGIGRATAEAFAAEGATVVFNGRRAELGKQVEQSIRRAGGKATYIRSDVRDRKQIKAFIDQAIKAHGRIDIAFNNAGIAIPPSPIEKVDPVQYKDIMLTNVDGVFWSMAYEVEHMKQAGGGVIINTSSVFGPHAANTQVPYGATRNAVIAMVEGVAKEAGGDNVRVVSVAPGAVPDTDLFRFMDRDWKPEELEYMASLSGLGRVGTSQDIAGVVLALASDAASFVHGSVVPVDGQFLNA